MYHESTYLHEHTKKAGDRFHSTSKQAATIARKAGAKKLLLGHFSSMYETLESLRKKHAKFLKILKSQKKAFAI